MTSTLAAVPDRRVPALGGFSLTFLRLEIRRMLRNRRTLVFTLIMPPAFFLLFGGLSDAYQQQTAGRGNVSAYLMISFAVYGSMIANTAAGASVAVERALGWSRQLRLTPLSPVQVVVARGAVATCLAILPITVISLIGALSGAALGIGLGLAMSQVLKDEGIKAISIPVAQIAVYVALAAVAGVVAAIGPARSAAKVDVLKAVVSD